jgi:16S rRNA (guanine1516-N2)-methyltransferase
MNERSACVAVCCDGEHAKQAQDLARQFGLTQTTNRDNHFDWLLQYEKKCLCLVDCRHRAFKPLSIDLNLPCGQITRNDPLRRAMGKGAKVVLDATTGLASDTLLLLKMGYKVIAVERSPVVVALLADAMKRCADDKIKQDLKLVHANAGDFLSERDSRELNIDVVYMDPMYPIRSKTSALARKECRVLRRIVGDDHDANQLLEQARRHVRRVAVKRPLDVPPIAQDVAGSITGKLVRFDIYRGAS